MPISFDKIVPRKYPLSPLQHGLFFHALFEPEAGHYVVQVSTRLDTVEPEHLHNAWLLVARRHDALRAHIAYNELLQPVQVVREDARLVWSTDDWRAFERGEQVTKLDEFLKSDRLAGFLFDGSSIMRFSLFQVGSQEFFFIWTFHHILLDGWSVSIILREVLETYECLRLKRPISPGTGCPYHVYLDWLRTQEAGAAEVFWRGRLSQNDDLRRISHVEQRKTADVSVGEHREIGVEVPLALLRGLQLWSRREKITLGSVLQGAWAIVLSRFTGERSVLFGCIVSGRPPQIAGIETAVGLFANALPLNIDLPPECLLSDWLRTIQKNCLSMAEFAHMPLSQIQGWADIPRGVQLFDSTLTVENYPLVETLNTISTSSVLISDVRVLEYTHYPLSVVANMGAGDKRKLSITFSYDVEEFHESFVRSISEHFLLALETILEGDKKLLGNTDHSFLSERLCLLGSEVESGLESGVSVVEAIRAAAMRNGEEVAVRFGQEEITYAELMDRMERLAHYLRSFGAGGEARIGLLLERSIDMVVAVLAVLRSGGAYVPLNPRDPDLRRSRIIVDAGISIVVTHSCLRSMVPDSIDAVVCLDAQKSEIASFPTAEGIDCPVADALAYILYTSGSTGTPKGVMVSHRGLSNYLHWAREAYRIEDGVGAPVHSSLGFDLTITSLLGPLVAGRTTYLLPEDDPVEHLAEAVKSGKRFSLIKITPAHLQLLAERLGSDPDLIAVGALVIGGEELRAEQLDYWRIHAPGTRIINEYGPTETVVGCSIYELLPDDERTGLVPIGRPIANSRLYLLDRYLHLAPAEVTAEIYIGGPGVARGYCNDPALTAEKFVPDHFAEIPGARMYRTGDLGRYRLDGTIEFLGRRDMQVKLRGFRIELGEIESALAQHDSIREARVTMRDSAAGAKRLIAYIVPSRGPALPPDEIRTFLASRLPDYMIPAAFVALEALPLTQNGKVDIGALPMPNPASSGARTLYVPPRTDTEKILADIWQQCLQIDQIGIHENFFELGGDSILSIQVAAKAKKAGLNLTVKDIFKWPTLEGLTSQASITKAIEASKSGHTPENKAQLSYGAAPLFPGVSAKQREWLLKRFPGVEAAYPLSPVQSGLLFHTLMDPDDNPYVYQRCLLLTRIESARFRQAWIEVVSRHQSLRTFFIAEDIDEPLQVVLSHADLRWNEEDWTMLPQHQQQERLTALQAGVRRKGFDLKEAPPVSFYLARVGVDSYYFLWTYHHILLDGWSTPLLLQEVMVEYERATPKHKNTRPEPPQYRSYISWLLGQDLDRAVDFWEQDLKHLAQPTIVQGRFCITETKASGYGIVSKNLDRSFTAQIHSFASRHHLTFSTLVHAAWSLLLGNICNTDRVVFGSTVSGRPAALEGVDEVIGLFINTLPFLVNIEPDMRVIDWLRALQDKHLEMRHYDYVPLNRLQSYAPFPRGAPLFDSIVAFENFPNTLDLAEASFTISPISATGGNHYPLSLIVSPSDHLEISIAFKNSFLNGSAVSQLLAQFEHLILGLCEAEGRLVGEITPAPPADQRRIVKQWNATVKEFPKDRCLHHLFETQVEQTPDLVALSYGAQTLTYETLNRRANALADYLRGLGIQAGETVGLALERSVELIVGILAVTKLGGAYAPLDIHSPDLRLVGILKELSWPYVLMTSDRRDSFERLGVKSIEIDATGLSHPGCRENNPDISVSSSFPICVLYTSGSSGAPKGVVNTHNALVNRILWMRDFYGIGSEDTVLQKTPITFDVSGWEIFLPLVCGAKLVLAPPELHTDPCGLAALIKTESISVVHFVPSMLGTFIGAGQLKGLSSLRYIFSSGEALTWDLQEQVFLNSKCQLVNLYGPTEAAIDVTQWQCNSGQYEGIVPIGKPISNISTYILDRYLRLLPAGYIGELCIGGVGLALGYVENTAETAAQFVPDAFGPSAGRLYRTGDLARYLPDGSIQYLGRCDSQIKHRGVRIELEEIEAQIRTLPTIRTAAVAVWKSQNGGSRLVAFVVSDAEGSLAPTQKELQAGLALKVPQHMVPGQFVYLKELPLTASGKLDRRRLSQIEISRGEQATYESPESEAEKALAEIWQEVLGVERVGIHDNFFELGGDSILSIQVVARSSRRDLRLTVRQVFESPTLAQLALLCEAASPRFETPTSPEDVSSVFDLTPIGVRFFEQELERPDHFNQSVLLQGAMDAAVLEVAVAKLVEHHDALRLRFERGPEGWRQSYAAAEEHRVVGHVDLSGLPEAGRRAELERLAEAAQSSLNLHEGPLLRVMQFDLGEQEQRLLAVVHHLAVDGVSWRILLEDLERLCEQASRGGPLEPGTGTASFRSWSEALSEYANSEEIKAEASFWISQQQAPVAPLAGRPSAEAGTVGQMRTAAVELTAEQTQLLLQGGPRKYRCQAQDLLLTALLLALRDWTGERRLQLDMEGHGREEVPGDLDVSRTVGWFTTVYPVVFELPPEEDLLAAVKSVRQQLRAVPRHGIGYGMLRYLSRDEQTRRTLAAAPGSPISFNYLGQFDQALGQSMRLAKESTGHGQHPANRSHYLLDVNALVVNRCFHLTFLYDEEHIPSERIEALQDGFFRRLFSLLHATPLAPALVPADFPLARLTQRELDTLLVRYPSLEDIYPLSPVQQGLLFHTLLSPDSGFYVLQNTVRLKGVDLPRFRRAWERAIERHEILRTAIVIENHPRPLQLVIRDTRILWEEFDWRYIGEEMRPNKLNELQQHLRARRFELEIPPLMRFAVVWIDRQELYFLWTYHHVILDGWSTPLLLNEVLRHYRAEGEVHVEPERVTPRFASYIKWLARTDHVAAENFWKTRLSRGIRTAMLNHNGSHTNENKPFIGSTSSGIQQHNTTSEFALRVLRAAHSCRVTPSTIFQLAWALVLSIVTGSDQIVFGITISGRPPELPGIEQMLGTFINTLPLQVDLKPCESLLSHLILLKDETVSIATHGFISLANLRGDYPDKHQVGFFDTILAYDNYPIKPITGNNVAGVAITEFHSFDRNHYPLALSIVPSDTFCLRATYDSLRFGSLFVNSILESIEHACLLIADDPHATLSDVRASLKLLQTNSLTKARIIRGERARAALQKSARQPFTMD